MKAVLWNSSSYRVRIKVLSKFRCDLNLWPFDPKMYRYLCHAILHLCKKYESCTLKTSQVILSKPKCWQSSVVTLTFDLLIPKYIGIFLLPSCIYVWSMKAVHWKLLKWSYQTFWPQNVKVSSSCHPASVYKIWSCSLKIWGFSKNSFIFYILYFSFIFYILYSFIFYILSSQNQSVEKVPLWLEPLTFWPKNV